MRKSLRTLFGVVLAGVMALSLIGCAGGGSGAGEDKVIGYVINNLNDTFQTFILNAAQEAAEEKGFEVRVENAREDLLTQQDAVNTLIQNGVDALVVIPVDTSGMDPIVRAATEAGIPLVFINRNPFAGEEDNMPAGVYYVGSNEITGGIMQMEFIGELLEGQGGIAVAMGILGNEGAVSRTEGVQQVIEEEYPDIEILAVETAQWQRDLAITLAENWISTFGDTLNAIVANNDEMALGALQATRSNNREDILIIGLDATPDALDAVADGGLVATVFQDAVGQGRGAMEILIEVFEGNAPPESVRWVDFRLVTQENIDEFR
ncbi:MAG: substrate-binding domain-containing protein [Lachnospiraceae bacterium]|nr:substrate-binding domain-containing protein [Lachnospiraceae bacterium]